MDEKAPQSEQIPPAGSPSVDEHPDTHLEREDDRWSPKAQLRDWFILLVMVAIYLIWTGVIYLFEPGIR